MAECTARLAEEEEEASQLRELQGLLADVRASVRIYWREIVAARRNVEWEEDAFRRRRASARQVQAWHEEVWLMEEQEWERERARERDGLVAVRRERERERQEARVRRVAEVRGRIKEEEEEIRLCAAEKEAAREREVAWMQEWEREGEGERNKFEALLKERRETLRGFQETLDNEIARFHAQQRRAAGAEREMDVLRYAHAVGLFCFYTGSLLTPM